MKTDTTNLVAAMYEMARTIQIRDGVSKEEIFEAIFEAAERIELQKEEIDRLHADRDSSISYAVAAERSRCISAVNDERVNNVSEEDVAYNFALDHACAAIQSGTWISTIESIDYLCEQARLAEREACALVCEQSSFPAFTARCFATDIRARSKP